ncbi:SRPBCC family protein [Rhodococcus kronopolitis]|uniref:SRPBCC family protein n=1 Tax=Rhodococcus kronopolitis TaxID=1460226 RepID=A0ABV9G0U0_9NOCA
MDIASVHIEAAPSAVWDAVTDISGYHRFSPENMGGRWTGGKPATVGATFTGSNRHGLIRWSTHCTVVDVVAGQKFSFEVGDSKTRWTYLLEPSDTGVKLTETREVVGTPQFYVRMVQRSKLLGRNRDELMKSGMQTTLARMKGYLER